jgi:hypothetical protein
MVGYTLKSAAEAFEEASVNSTESTKKAAKTTKRALGAGLQKAAYALSYGMVYAVSFLTELLPEENAFRRGFVEGAKAALEARKKVRASRETPKNTLAAGRVRANAKPLVKASPRAKKAVKKHLCELDGMPRLETQGPPGYPKAAGLETFSLAAVHRNFTPLNGVQQAFRRPLLTRRLKR